MSICFCFQSQFMSCSLVTVKSLGQRSSGLSYSKGRGKRRTFWPFVCYFQLHKTHVCWTFLISRIWQRIFEWNSPNAIICTWYRRIIPSPAARPPVSPWRTSPPSTFNRLPPNLAALTTQRWGGSFFFFRWRCKERQMHRQNFICLECRNKNYQEVQCHF